MPGGGKRSLGGCFIEDSHFALGLKKCLLARHSLLHTSLSYTLIPNLKVVA